MNDFLSLLKSENPPLFYFGLICLVGATFCLLAVRLRPVQLLGTSAWYKPFKFFLSTTFFVWTMGWLLQHLEGEQMIAVYSWAMIALLAFENGYILLQASRGQLSHFNQKNGFYAFMYSLMALAAVGISIGTVLIAIPFFTREISGISSSYLWGIRLGISVFVVFSMQGLMMGGRLAHTVGKPDGSPGLPVVNWSRTAGDLRIAHFLGLHALQAIPLAGWLLPSPGWVMLFAALYAAAVMWVLMQALRGKPLVR